jgi:ribosomal protein S18
MKNNENPANPIQNCVGRQRQLAVAIKNARFMGLLPEVK